MPQTPRVVSGLSRYTPPSLSSSLQRLPIATHPLPPYSTLQLPKLALLFHSLQAFEFHSPGAFDIFPHPHCFLFLDNSLSKTPPRSPFLLEAFIGLPSWPGWVAVFPLRDCKATWTSREWAPLVRPAVSEHMQRRKRWKS